jgi:hypothetical protein
MNQPVRVALDSWIIIDGNYRNFRCGNRYAFALQLWNEEPLVIQTEGDIARPTMAWLGAWNYAVKGAVVHVAESWWVLDVGVRLYKEGPAPGPLGAIVSGQIGIGMDPFFYFESLAHEPGAPALIYDWRVETIELDTAPLVEVGPRVFARDRSRQGWKQIGETDAAKDGGGYVLTCTRLPGEPRRTR